MTRGVQKTLSDGEKTSLAFCYFIASAHKKVAVSTDYAKLFFVFDDPVTSMSYDYIFSICQILKNLTVSNAGDISVTPGNINRSGYFRPRLLILTHSSYLFNIASTNRVVDPSSSFALHSEGPKHVGTRLNTYIAPFQHQLREVLAVADGRPPDHSTGNAVRSVLEAVGRFCFPNKSDSLTVFLQFLASEGGFVLRSVLINSLCHGSFIDETPPPDDIKLACVEATEVVRRYAPGQLEVAKK